MQRRYLSKQPQLRVAKKILKITTTIKAGLQRRYGSKQPLLRVAKKILKITNNIKGCNEKEVWEVGWKVESGWKLAWDIVSVVVIRGWVRHFACVT